MKAKRDVPGLIKALKYRKSQQIREAATARGRFDGPCSLTPLIDMLSAESWEARLAAAKSLVGIYRRGRLAQPDVQRILEWRRAIRMLQVSEHVDRDCSFIGHNDYHSNHGIGIDCPL